MSDRVRLPLLAPEEFQSSLASDGHRRFVYAAEVHGRFHGLRRIVFALLIAIWIALPLIPLNGHPLVLLDVQRRSFYFFGATFNSQDAWLAFFGITAVGWTLALSTSLLGRAFCGYACPQTVFLDGVFRPIERFVEGSREKRMRRDKGPWTWEKLGRKVLKHVLFAGAAFVIAHITLSFFVPLPQTLRMVVHSPAEHPEAFAWAAAVTLVTYGNFAFFREQLCLVICPYGRLQASLVDDDSLVIGYDEKRGEPRGKLNSEGVGDCVDCKRCVAVCPTGIDIRNGLQLDCIACTACVDACDEIMVKVGKPKGLVRYDSKRAFSGGKRRILRPRLLVYAVAGLVGLMVATFAFSRRTSFEANLTRAPGAPFVVEDGAVRNTFVLHLVNKRNEPAEFEIAAEGATITNEEDRISVGPMSDARVNVVTRIELSTPGEAWTLKVRRTNDGETLRIPAKIVRPN